MFYINCELYVKALLCIIPPLPDIFIHANFLFLFWVSIKAEHENINHVRIEIYYRTFKSVCMKCIHLYKQITAEHESEQKLAEKFWGILLMQYVTIFNTREWKYVLIFTILNSHLYSLIFLYVPKKKIDKGFYC